MTIKNVLITGASGGIGQSIAKVFDKKNFNVALAGRNIKKLENLSTNFKNNSEVFFCDLSSTKDISKFCTNIKRKFKNVDILINNAGITNDSLFIRMDEKKWDSVIHTNLKANFLLTNFFIKDMIKKRWGRVINITSVVGHTGNQGQSNYTASKAGVVGLTKSVAMEVARRGITVNCVSPGFIETSMTRSLSESQREFILNNIPMKKVGRPIDVANCVEFLSSENANYITGETLHVNGGISMI